MQLQTAKVGRNRSLECDSANLISSSKLIEAGERQTTPTMPNPGDFTNLKWKGLETVHAKTFVCGYCGNQISSEKGYCITYANGNSSSAIYICPNCRGATYFPPSTLIQIPGSAYGNNVGHVPASLNALYQEARSCTANSNYTAAVLICRKILMNIAVEQKAAEGLRFVEYVDYLSNQGFVPPNGKQWVDHIRKKGNEANHEIALMRDQDAKDLIIFIEMLLKFIYEFPNLIPKMPAVPVGGLAKP